MTIKTPEPFTIWLIGPSASGKSTIAKELYNKIQSKVSKVIILDGDNIRDLFDNRYGYDAISRSKVTKRYIKLVKWLQNFQISSIVSVISPFEKDRNEARSLISNDYFIEIFCKASLETCEERDVKGLYKLARAGKIKNYTGIDSPYEIPENPELIINTDKETLDYSVTKILKFLERSEFNY